MPKGKKKVKGGGRRSADSRPASEEEYDTADNKSTVSCLSDQTDSIPEEDVEDGGVDETSAQDNFEEKLRDAIDGLTQKSAQGRKSCLDVVNKALSKKFLGDFLADRKMTLSDAAARCLKKGKGDEQSLAARCFSMLCIQLGAEADDIMSEVRPILLTIMADNSASLKARGECAIAVAMCAFISNLEIDEVISVMEAFESIFRQSFKKGDGSVPVNSPEVCRLHCNALTAWGLLISIAPQFLVDRLIKKYLWKLPHLLESNDVDLRIAAGETLALLYEVGREDDEEFEGQAMVELVEMLRRLSTESHKYVAKKDRRQQKSSFRDIFRAIQDCEAPEMSIKFAQETLEIYSWVTKMQYGLFCQALGSGVYQHLQWNTLVRDVFGLGSPVLVTSAAKKPTKWERTMYNAAAFKARTKARSKFRDKRSVMVNGAE